MPGVTVVASSDFKQCRSVYLRKLTLAQSRSSTQAVAEVLYRSSQKIFMATYNPSALAAARTLVRFHALGA